MRWLRFLYPRRWWDRYGDELLALIEERGLSASDIVDIALGALDAHTNYAKSAGRLRSGQPLSRWLLLVWISTAGMLALLGYFMVSHPQHEISVSSLTWGAQPEALTLLAAFVGLLFTGCYLALAVAALGMLQDIHKELQRRPE